MMKQSVLLLILLSAASVITESSVKAPYIVGGHPAEPDRFPYHVSLQMRYNGMVEHSCGATILTPFWLLTAAHCYTSDYVYHIVAGIIDLKDENPQQQLRNVSDFILHPKYIGPMNRYLDDIALLLLEERLEFNDYIQPVELPKSGSVPQGYAVIAGWGSTDWWGFHYSYLLLKLSVAILPDSVCENDFPGYSKEGQACMGPMLQGPCPGDAGGGVVQNGEVIGIMSYSISRCATGHPAVITKVSSYIDFIGEHIY